MQRLEAVGARRARIVLFVPRWLPAGEPAGLPYRVFPVLSSLAKRGLEVDFFTALHDEIGGSEMRASLEGAFAAVVWCAELNPACQIPGILECLAFLKETAPALPRIAGGGFFELLPPPRLTAPGLADLIVGESAVGALGQLIERMLDGVAETPGQIVRPARREPMDSWAVLNLDASSFIRPEAMIFRNQNPSLQIPTGYGCAKHCRFCFYENTGVTLLAEEAVVDLVIDLKNRYGISQFLMGELDFLTSKRRALGIAQGLLDRRADIEWFALASIQDVLELSDGELRLLYRSGCRVIELGTEAGTDQALGTIGKRFTVAQAETASRRLIAQGIATIHNILLGFKGETQADRRGTIDLVERLKRTGGGQVRFNFRVYQPAPSTTMGEDALSMLPAMPHDLHGIAAYRVEEALSMPWLDREDERRVKLLVEYLLPLAYDDALSDGTAHIGRRLLRRIARARCRTGFFRWGLDRSIFERIEKQGIAATFIP